MAVRVIGVSVSVVIFHPAGDQSGFPECAKDEFDVVSVVFGEKDGSECSGKRVQDELELKLELEIGSEK